MFGVLFWLGQNFTTARVPEIWGNFPKILLNLLKICKLLKNFPKKCKFFSENSNSYRGDGNRRIIIYRGKKGRSSPHSPNAGEIFKFFNFLTKF